MFDRDFTVSIYRELVHALKDKVTFSTFEDYRKDPGNAVILRHDVDKLPAKSLEFARIQAELGIRASYYFRILPCSFDRGIIREIATLGHEIGYHYEDLALADGDVNAAIALFSKHLGMLREFYPVKTICMHGSPTSKYDNRLLWQNHDYREWGLTGEPYFDLDFKDIFYLTDTGRSWNGDKFSIRDRPMARQTTGEAEPTLHHAASRPVYRSTTDIIKAVREGSFPTPAMMTFHPQRWHNQAALWATELVWQNTKNIIKRQLRDQRDKNTR